MLQIALVTYRTFVAEQAATSSLEQATAEHAAVEPATASTTSPAARPS